MALVTYSDVMKRLIELNVGRYAQIETGDNTSATASKLVDSSATFVTNKAKQNMIVQNRTDSSFSYIVSVDSETQLTLADDIFTDTDNKYFVWNYEDMSHTDITEQIEMTDQYVYDRLRSVISDPESTIDTSVQKYKTIKFIAVKIAVCEIAKIIYKLVLDDIPSSILSGCEWAEDKLDMFVNGDLQISDTTDANKSGVYSASDNDRNIFRMKDYDGEESVNDWYEPNMEINGS